MLYSTCLLLCSFWTCVSAWLPSIEIKGNKLFDSETEQEFRIKGIAYYPRANDGNFSVGGFDFTTDEYEYIWSPHINTMKDLGVNTIRLYAVDPSQSHDKFMCAASEAGIYVLVGMAAPCLGCAIHDIDPPACYSDGAMFNRAMQVYNAFAIYDNTLGFSVGNENNLMPGITKSAPCVKALIRDVKNYVDVCFSQTGIRRVPIGLDLADVNTPNAARADWLRYYDCTQNKNEYERADWISFNPYVECDPLTHKTFEQSAGLQLLMKDYENTKYPRPIMFGEFGCILGKNTVDGYENQRTFYDAKWMNEEPGMTNIIVGGNVFEFSTELENLQNKKMYPPIGSDTGRYGIGYFSPEKCDYHTIPCTYEKTPEFDNLKTMYTSTNASTLKLKEFKIPSDTVLTCPNPENFNMILPQVIEDKILACTARQAMCNNQLSNAKSKEQSKKNGAKPTTMGDNKKPTNNPAEDQPTLSFATAQYSFKHTILFATLLGLSSLFL